MLWITEKSKHSALQVVQKDGQKESLMAKHNLRMDKKLIIIIIAKGLALNSLMKTPKKEANFTTFSTLYPLPPSYHQNLLIFFQKNNPHKIRYHRPSKITCLFAAPYQGNDGKPTPLEAHSKPSPSLHCEVDMYQVTKRSIKWLLNLSKWLKTPQKKQKSKYKKQAINITRPQLANPA